MKKNWNIILLNLEYWQGFYIKLRPEIKYMNLNSSGGVILSHSVGNKCRKIFTINIIIHKNVFK